MAVEIIFPRVDMDMVAGRVTSWLVADGAPVRQGDPLFEIETDKATMEIEAPSSGVLRGVRIADGEEVPVGTAIGWIVAEGEAWQGASQTAAVSDVAPTPPDAMPAPQRGVVRATPLARRDAQRAGIDPAGIAGSGPQGRIHREDVRNFILHAKEDPAPPPPAAITAPHRKIPNSNIRRTIARRLSQSKQCVPHFYVSIEIELDRLLALRGELNAAAPKDGPGQYKLSVNDLLIKACAVTLRRVPGVNASYTDEAIIQYDDVDISVAVSIPDGLITPIVRRADARSLSQISNEARALIARARDGKLKPDEFQGGSFSISNMGMYGVRDFSAIINPPQGAILAIGAGERRAVVRENDRIEVASVMTCTLSVDHRVIDGALAAQWMSVFKSVVEAPMSLVV